MMYNCCNNVDYIYIRSKKKIYIILIWHKNNNENVYKVSLVPYTHTQSQVCYGMTFHLIACSFYILQVIKNWTVGMTEAKL